MPKRQGLIPLRDRVTQLGRIYGKAADDIARALLRFDIGDYQELKVMKTEEEIDRILKKLNRSVIKWSNGAIPDAYKKGHDVSVTRLEILGADRDREFSPMTHKNAVGDWADITIDGLLRTNMSIKPNVNTYLYLVKQASNSLMQIQEFDLRDEEVIAGLLDDAINEGASRGELESIIRVHFKRDLYEKKFIKINGRNYNMTKYARMVARTRMRQTQSVSVKNTCNQYDNDLVEISDHGTTTLVCLPYEGNTYSIGGKTPGYEVLSEWPPFHPNCLLPGQRCKTPGGIISGMRARYHGKAAKITFANAGDLSVTVNHLFLTPNGFAPAHLLRKGDDVFYCPGFEGIGFGDPNENKCPSTIDNIIRSLSESRGMITRSVPATPEDFHNDGRFCNGNVNIIRPDGFLHDTEKPTLAQQVSTDKFNPGCVTPVSFFPPGSFAEILHSAAHASDSIMGGLRSPSPVFLARSGSRDPMGFADTSLGETDLSKDKVDGLISDFKILSKIALQSSGLISIDKVLNVDFFPYHGFVYDLHTKTSLYIVNSVLSSNCEHSAAPTSAVAQDFRVRYA